MPNKAIFIPGNVPSSKNGRVNTTRGSFASKTVSKYKQLLGVKSYSSSKKTFENYKTRQNLFEGLTASFMELKQASLDKPLLVGIHFVRQSKHKYDHHNMVQIIADLQTAHDWIVDDDTTETLFFPMLINGAWESFDKEKPGCWVSVLDKDLLWDGLTLEL